MQTLLSTQLWIILVLSGVYLSIGLSDAPKYDIISTENGDVIDS